MPRREALTPAGLDLLDRRGFLARTANGLAAIALVDLLGREGVLGADMARGTGGLHHPTRAKRVIQVFCTGAVSHVDTFDHKPELERRHGEPMPGVDKLITFQGENGALARSPWTFRPRGETGKMTSDLLPEIGGLADRLCFMHSMTSRTNTHGPGETFLSTGSTREGFPSIGAWVSYGLGSEAADLPAYVAIPDPRGVPQQGPANWSSGFLPGQYQGTPLGADRPIPHLARPEGLSADADAAARDLLARLNAEHLKKHPADAELVARMESYELAARLQLAAPEVTDLTGESRATRSLYGLDDPNPIKAGFARNCLLARRLVERGVRYVTLFNGAFAMGEGNLNWDGHRRIKSDYDRHGPILDQPVAGLVRDLDARGLLDDVLVVWTTEFGRMPTFQKGAEGRDHNPAGFTVWLCGAGVKRGMSFGATDEFGHRAAVDPIEVHDLHATILHLLGIDHTRLTYRFNGIERRLTDVHGRVVEAILS
jgi:hypothetical protein